MGPLNRRSIVGGGLLLAASAAHATGRQPRSGRGAGAPRAMTDVLRAAGPHVEPGEDPQARIFDRFAGTWATDYAFIQDDGTRQTSSGHFIAGWVLEGRALQDIWIWEQPGERRPWMGTTLRFFDTERRIWRVTWVTPFARAVLMLEGGLEGEDIVLHADDPSVKRRWSFYDIRADSFRWKNERSTDGGATWRLREDHRMRRQTA
jgi:hypothetical protein